MNGVKNFPLAYVAKKNGKYRNADCTTLEEKKGHTEGLLRKGTRQ